MSTKKKERKQEFVNETTGNCLPFRTAYDGVRIPSNLEVGEAITKQSFKDMCDVNKIVARWNKTGVLDNVNVREGVYGDFSNIVDYTESVRRVERAMEDFMSLPADLRSYFDNDPGNLIDGIGDPERAQELRDLGLEELVDHIHGTAEPADTGEPGEPETPPVEEPPRST